MEQESLKTILDMKAAKQVLSEKIAKLIIEFESDFPGISVDDLQVNRDGVLWTSNLTTSITVELRA